MQERGLTIVGFLGRAKIQESLFYFISFSFFFFFKPDKLFNDPARSFRVKVFPVKSIYIKITSYSGMLETLGEAAKSFEDC